MPTPDSQWQAFRNTGRIRWKVAGRKGRLCEGLRKELLRLIRRQVLEVAVPAHPGDLPGVTRAVGPPAVRELEPFNVVDDLHQAVIPEEVVLRHPRRCFLSAADWVAALPRPQ